MTGKTLGPYRILDKIGEGGMGQVYRAHDGRLNRDVALKLLRPELALHGAGLPRFEREARAAAALNHPNIVAVFDVGVDGNDTYVVTELLEGETLRAALARGALPHRTALDVAVQTARGIAAAHQRGIVHRDLKPENIFLTRDARVKILDFGLAKLTETAGVAEGLTQADTMPGAVFGTAGYMAPEQVRGEPVDARADIFAFGAVFYEMLSGKRAFAADSAIDVISAILRVEPPELAPGDVPPALDQIVRRCLQKNPDLRFQHAGDIAFALEAMSGSSASPREEPSVPASRRHPRLRLRNVVAAAGLLALGALIGTLAQRESEPVATVPRFQARTFDRLPVTAARFMPDGQTIVFSAAPSGYAPELFVLSPSVEAPQPLGIANAQLLSVSSKGELALIIGAQHLEQRLYSGTLARMTLGSSPRPMLERVREADWAPDGASLAIVRDLGNGRDRLEYPVGTALREATGYLSDPRVSPDGSRVAFFEHPWRFDDRGHVKVVDRSGTLATLDGDFWGLQGLAWTPDGSRVVFSGSIAGGAVLQPMVAPISGRVAPTPALGVPGRFIVHDVARDGRWLGVREDLSFGVRARTPGQPDERELSWLGSSGARAMSENGEWLLMVDVGAGGGADYGVVLRKTDATQTIRLGEGNAQQLSPDGRWASALLSTPPQVVLYPTGAGDRITFAGRGFSGYGSAEWFPDSRRLLVCAAEGSRAPRCYEQDLAGSPPRALTPEGVLASIAPDGQTLLLTRSDGSSYLSTVGGNGGRPAALRSDDRRIAWSRDSRAMFVQRGLSVPAVVERVDLASGARTIVGRLAPEDVGAVAMIYVMAWADDGRWYAYNYTSIPSTLFVVFDAMGRRGGS